ncbi:MAG: HAMP domain-containing sensor histidine kinase, partial [Acidobacteriota bacterium]
FELAREEDQRASQRARELMRSTLRSLDDEIHRVLERYESDLAAALDDIDLASPAECRGLRQAARRVPFGRQLFVSKPTTGELLYPSLLDSLDPEEEAFLDRTRSLWTDGPQPGEGLEGALQEAGVAIGPARGWYPWFRADGLHLIYWRRASELVVGAEIDRTRLLADVIALLPDTDPRAPELLDGRIRLLDSRGKVLYQWGAYTPAADERPTVRHGLQAPLAAWALDYLSPGLTVARTLPALVPAVAALIGVVLGLAIYFYRESAREIRQAAQRVSFVDQVSHELKTPLTNIRMYAELLADDLAEDDATPRAHAAVIISESQRLSRLILNILTFSRKDRDQLALRREPGQIDDAVAAVLVQFRPVFEARGIEAHFTPCATQRAAFDRDKLEQILGNLLSNVEKYAAGQRVHVTSRQAGDEVVITVADHGPGIPNRECQRVFEPFYRISNALSEGVSGTGIGLSLARQLARTHGGELELVPSASGACFRLTVQCPQEAQ